MTRLATAAEEIQGLYNGHLNPGQDPAVEFATLSDVLARFTATDPQQAEAPDAKTLTQMSAILLHAAMFTEHSEQAPTALRNAWESSVEAIRAIETGSERKLRTAPKADNQPTTKRRFRF